MGTSARGAWGLSCCRADVPCSALIPHGLIRRLLGGRPCAAASEDAARGTHVNIRLHGAWGRRVGGTGRKHNHCALERGLGGRAGVLRRKHQWALVQIG